MNDKAKGRIAIAYWAAIFAVVATPLALEVSGWLSPDAENIEMKLTMESLIKATGELEDTLEKINESLDAHFIQITLLNERMEKHTH